jgi:hypothetical protein
MATSPIPWESLLRRIDDGSLTPFLGAGMSRPPLPGAADLAAVLAGQYDYPFVNKTDLMEVAQFVATTFDNSEPKNAVAAIFKKIPDPDFDDADQPHSILARLPLPVYLTTNYDDYMEKALLKRNRSPLSEVCRWNSELRRDRTSHLEAEEPKVGEPVVFHIHGFIDDPDSFVLTEDDYLDFMVNVRRHEAGGNPTGLALPPKVTALLSSTSLLFLGYGLRDWNLRVLLRALVQSADVSSRKVSVSVQVEPRDDLVDALGRPQAIRYLERYFDGLSIRVYWGTAKQFLAELKEKWDKRPSNEEAA